MPTSWLSWRRSLACKPQPGDVHDPKSLNADTARAKVEAAVFVNRRVYMRSGCSRSIANLRDVIHSSRRIDGAHVPAMPNFSPKSVESNDFVQSISHETLVQEHGCGNHSHYRHDHEHSLHGKLISLDDIVASHHPHPYHHHHLKKNGSRENINASTGASGSFYGTPLHPSVRKSSSTHAPPTPLHHSQVASRGSSFRRLSGCNDCKNPQVAMVAYKTSTAAARASKDTAAVHSRNGSGEGMQLGVLPLITVPRAVCQRCGETFPQYEFLEQHHLLKHAVAELQVGDSSRNVVEIIFKTSWLRPPEPPTSMATSPTGGGVGRGGHVKIVRVLKVNNLAHTLARFEDYREGVKMRASKLPKKHPRCLADGNELLRFYGARLECELLRIDIGAPGNGASTAPCSSATCSICKIIRNGFPKSRGAAAGTTDRGILTTATSGRAHQLMVSESAVGIGGGGDVVQEEEHRNSIAGIRVPQLVAGEGAGDVGPPRSSHIKDDEAALRQRGATHADRQDGLMAMLVCRVIAGRVLKPPRTTSTSTAATPPTPPHSGEINPAGGGFDSVAGGEVGSFGRAGGLHSRFEELTVFNPRAILPCFVVLYRLS